MAKERNLLALDGLETATLTREEWQLIDMAICGFIALCALRAAAPKQEKLQSLLRKIRGLWFEDRHERRQTGHCRVCGHHGRDCTGRQRPRAHAQKELA
ncbi:MAG: hypothetical protein K2X77_17390 [Candidatus Obscuribacterales bacterium]|nr:hypothetical protein [Candidatus Obscuribacterales bacterium]